MPKPSDVFGRTLINVTRDGSDDLKYVNECGLSGIRIPVTIADAGPPSVRHDLRHYLNVARSYGLKILLLLDRDAFYWPDWRQSTDTYVQFWMSFYVGLFDGMEVGNEWDHKSPSSWDIAPKDFSDLLHAVRAATGPSVYLVSGGMAEGQSFIAQQVDFSPVDAFGVHPYLKDAPNPNDIEDVPDVDVLISSYSVAIPGKSAVITEWGWPWQDRQAEETSEMIAWSARNDIPLFLFNLRDSTETFGLLNQDYSKKPAFDAVKSAILSLSAAPIPPPDHPQATSQGIDVSNNNGTIDWPTVAAVGISWAYAKATEGPHFRDSFFPANWSSMEALLEVRGAYCFARPSQSDPISQAINYLDWVEAAGGFQPGDIAVLDHEDENADWDTGQWALDWLHYVEDRIGFKPMIYTGKWVIDNQNLAAHTELGEYGLILAAYQSGPPGVPAPWTLLAGWQNDDHTGVPGVAGDHDVFFGDIDQLKKYGKPGSTTVPAKPQPSGSANLISALGYLGGDVAALLDAKLAQMSVPPLEPKSSKQTKDYWKQRSNLLESMIHQMYKDGESIKDEIIRTTREALK